MTRPAMKTIWSLRFMGERPTGTWLEFHVFAIGATQREAVKNALEHWGYTECGADKVKLINARDRGVVAAQGWSFA